MRQIGLVFWKDVRHLWRELCLYALILLAFAFVAPQVWAGRTPVGFVEVFVTLLKVLMVASWLVLIARVVHADGLVGDDKFWLTRPYRWQSLLGAKVLFVVMCVFLPFILMQWGLLLQAGLNPFEAKAGMALCLLRIGLNVMLPFLVIATVTDSLATVFSFVAGIMVTWAALLTFIMTKTDNRMSPPYSLAVFCVAMGGLMFGIVVYQYAQRRTMSSRLAIGGVLGLFLLMIFGYDRGGFGNPIKALIRNHYPVSDSVRLSFAENLPYNERGEDNLQILRDQVEVKLPIKIDGLPPEAKLRSPHIALEINGGGAHYASPWQDAALSEHAVGFVLPKDVLDRFVAVNAKVRLELVAEELMPTNMKATTVSERFAGPMNGVCGLMQGQVICRYSYREWTPARAELDGCGQRSIVLMRHVPAGTTPDPVVNEVLHFEKVCEGAQLIFTEYSKSKEIRLEVGAENVRLGSFRAQ